MLSFILCRPKQRLLIVLIFISAMLFLQFGKLFVMRQRIYPKQPEMHSSDQLQSNRLPILL